MVATALAKSLDKSFPWAVGFFFGNTSLSLERNCGDFGV